MANRQATALLRGSMEKIRVARQQTTSAKEFLFRAKVADSSIDIEQALVHLQSAEASLDEASSEVTFIINSDDE